MTDSSDKPMKANIFAAGAVLWRPAGGDPTRLAGGDVEVAVVHRPRYDDWSFPKGKLDPGETAVVAAVREIREETGFRPVLGRHLGRVTYPVPGHRKLKRVDYWAAKPADGEFVPNDEVDELRWVTPEAAFDQLSYPMDRSVLRRFRLLPADTGTVVIVRHAKAGSRKKHRGDDRTRPLDAAGKTQAAALVPQLRAFGGDSVTSADRTRCVDTVAPFAADIGVEVALEPSLSEEEYNADPQLGRKRALDIVARGGTPVICSQGKVIPDLVSWWAARDGITLPPARNRKASMWVLSLKGDRLLAADHLDSPLPSKQS
ncbi:MULTISPECIES: NUDIX hydrolase [unclassified Rhodococcus (in: high G+C Gram-positive bacteria)]|uniref:NUDIX hydrolase n=1 Tax=unclassified Rhodococcus (in: high G+C Gram-positive bacteria) TaxID=192944 RepID=UPI00146D32FB|nr:NUDIX hydrolase [Rhodococcus sp. (in: high G+C Gram-positive bacteria)]NMD95072.1 NUDIX hydrolase [Rhodococcus sp. BL-253-APC-6A1W]NME78566.1 NUDIX hydrolase [Rhodococcus sp. 105337]